MTPYLAVLGARFRVLLQYRAAAVAGFVTQVFWGFIRVMIFTAFFHSTDLAQPMTLEEVVTFVWLGQALFMLLPWRPDPDVEEMVKTGNVAYEMLRPMDLYAFWYMRSVAARTAPTLLRSMPLLVLAYLFFGLSLPPSPIAFALFLAGLAGSVMVGAALTSIITVTLLWTVSGQGVRVLNNVGVWVLSGIAMPITFYPDWALPVIEALPFRALMDTPFRLYLGDLSNGAAVAALAHQLLWTAALVLVGRFVLSRGTRRLVVQGG